MYKLFKNYIRDNFFLLSYLISKYQISKNSLNNDLVKNLKFKNKYYGEKCYIIGTGPSVNKFNLASIYDEHCFTLNFFFKHPEFKNLNKKYICLAPIHEPLDNSIWDFIFIDKKKIIEDAHLFIGDTKSKNTFSKYSKKNNIDMNNISLLNYFSSPHPNFNNINFKYFHDISIGPLFAPITSMVVAFQVCVYMGFKEINLIGIDHDAIKNPKNRSNPHFYKEHESYEFNESISKINKNTFEWYYKAWSHYEVFNYFFKKNNIKVFNLNKDSYLDVFDFKNSI